LAADVVRGFDRASPAEPFVEIMRAIAAIDEQAAGITHSTLMCRSWQRVGTNVS
jgi:hypothetical protein